MPLKTLAERTPAENHDVKRDREGWRKAKLKSKRDKKNKLSSVTNSSAIYQAFTLSPGRSRNVEFINYRHLDGAVLFELHRSQPTELVSLSLFHKWGSREVQSLAQKCSRWHRQWLASKPWGPNMMLFICARGLGSVDHPFNLYWRIRNHRRNRPRNQLKKDIFVTDNKYHPAPGMPGVQAQLRFPDCLTLSRSGSPYTFWGPFPTKAQLTTQQELSDWPFRQVGC